MRTRLPVRLKLAVVSAALTFAILCLFSVVIGAVAEQRIRSGFDDEIRATAADLQNQIAITPDARGRQRLEEEDQQLLDLSAAGGAVVRILDLRGEVRYPVGAEALGDPGEGLSHFGGLRVATRELVAPALDPDSAFNNIPRPVTQPVAFLQFGKPEGSVERTVNKVRLFLAFGVIGGTLLAFLGGLWVAHRAMRPIAGLTRAAREVAKTRNPDITLPKPQANDEVSDLAHTFEEMLGELSAARAESEAALTRQRAFVADASHELRTPLTSILTNLELLESELRGEPREMAGSALRSSRRMRRLVADLLLLARADSGHRAPQRSLDLSAVVREAAEEAGAMSAGHTVSIDAPDPVAVTGTADDLHRLVANLVENALVHTPAGTPITVSVQAEQDSAVLEVTDRGPGVAENLRARVFERFGRGGGDSAAVPGSGLGLAIVRAVAEAHGGRAELLEAEGGGVRFQVRLPLAGAAAPAPNSSEAPARDLA